MSKVVTIGALNSELWCFAVAIGYLLAAIVVLALTTLARAVDWVRGGDDGKQTRWGIRGGLQFAIAPAVRRRGDHRFCARVGVTWKS